MEKVISIMLGLAVLNSCALTSEELSKTLKESWGESIELNMTYQGNLHGAGEEGIYESNLVIQTEHTWRELLSKMNSVNGIVLSSFTKGENERIDFDKKTVIACFDKIQNSGGYTIEIVDIEEGRDQLTVWIKKGSPSSIATSVMTQPYSIVVIPATTKMVEFKLKNQSN